MNGALGEGNERLRDGRRAAFHVHRKMNVGRAYALRLHPMCVE